MGIIPPKSIRSKRAGSLCYSLYAYFVISRMLYFANKRKPDGASGRFYTIQPRQAFGWGRNVVGLAKYFTRTPG